MLVMHTRSLSTMVILLMPLRTRLSAHHDPTPPTPKMMTRFVAMLLTVSWPNSSSVLRNIACSIAIIGCKGTNKREQYKTKSPFCCYCRAKVPSALGQDNPMVPSLQHLHWWREPHRLQTEEPHTGCRQSLGCRLRTDTGVGSRSRRIVLCRRARQYREQVMTI